MNRRAVIRAVLAAPVGGWLGYWLSDLVPPAWGLLVSNRLWTDVTVPAAAALAARGTPWRLSITRIPGTSG